MRILWAMLGIAYVCFMIGLACGAIGDECQYSTIDWRIVPIMAFLVGLPFILGLLSSVTINIKRD